MLKAILKKYESKELQEAKMKILALEESLSQPTTLSSLLSTALETDLSWFNFEEIEDPGEKKRYREMAKEILDSPLIRNEISFIKSNWAKQALLDLSDVPKEKRQEHMEKMCWMIIGIHSFMLRLQEIAPSKVVNVNVEDGD